MFPTKNSLPANVRERSCGLLNQNLANLTGYQLTVRVPTIPPARWPGTLQ